jgi:hypothetical protein
MCLVNVDRMCRDGTGDGMLWDVRGECVGCGVKECGDGEGDSDWKR